MRCKDASVAKFSNPLLMVVGSLRNALIVFVLLTSFFALTAEAQHTQHEIAFEFASAGQLPLIHTSDQAGFFTNPLILRLEYQAVTNNVQSLSVFLESVSETRGRDQLWSYFPSRPFNAHVDETVHITSLGLITQRTLVSTGNFRIAAGLGIGFGLGRPSVLVRNKSTDSLSTTDAANTWDGLLVQAQLRARYTIIRTDKYDIGLMLVGRYWAFPVIGALGATTDVYNGPAFSSAHELGYLLGLSFGF